MPQDEVLILGNLTIDHNLTEGGRIVSPGGSAFFCSRIFRNLSLSPTIISPYGKDFDISQLGKVSLFPGFPVSDKTLIFRNILTVDGSREQYVHNRKCSDFNCIGNISRELFKNKKIAVIAPILNNLTYDQIKRWQDFSRGAYSVLLPQGFFRNPELSGKVRKRNWTHAEKTVKLFDLIVVSADDFSGMDKIAEKWSKNGPLCIVTKAHNGCSIYQLGRRRDYMAFDVPEPVDSTGAGDIFASAFAFIYTGTKNIDFSAVFANAAAALSLRYTSGKLQYSYKDIINLVERGKHYEHNN